MTLDDYTKQAAFFRLRQRGFGLAAEIAEYLASLDDGDATLVRELEPSIDVSLSDRSGSTYVSLDSITSRISDHAGGAADEINEYLDAAQMVARWLKEQRSC